MIQLTEPKIHVDLFKDVNCEYFGKRFALETTLKINHFNLVVDIYPLIQKFVDNEYMTTLIITKNKKTTSNEVVHSISKTT